MVRPFRAWQVVEERRDDDLASKDTVASTLKYQYVWGVRYIDAPVCRDEDTGDGSGGDPDGDCIDSDDEHLYYTQDANFNVTALVDGSDGDVVERYMYSPYGEPTFLEADWSKTNGPDGQSGTADDGTSSDYANEILYCGYYHDWETGLYHVRHRYYHPPLGRWTSRDPIAATSAYQYCRSRPVSLVDSKGLVPHEPSVGDYVGGYSTGHSIPFGITVWVTAWVADDNWLYTEPEVAVRARFKCAYDRETGKVTVSETNTSVTHNDFDSADAGSIMAVPKAPSSIPHLNGKGCMHEAGEYKECVVVSWQGAGAQEGRFFTHEYAADRAREANQAWEDARAFDGEGMHGLQQDMADNEAAQKGAEAAMAGLAAALDVEADWTFTLEWACCSRCKDRETYWTSYTMDVVTVGYDRELTSSDSGHFQRFTMETQYGR